MYIVIDICFECMKQKKKKKKLKPGIGSKWQKDDDDWWWRTCANARSHGNSLSSAVYDEKLLMILFNLSERDDARCQKKKKKKKKVNQTRIECIAHFHESVNNWGIGAVLNWNIIDCTLTTWNRLIVRSYVLCTLYVDTIYIH